MKKFKVGDRVRYIGNLLPNRRGAIGTVRGFTFENDQAHVSWDDNPSPDGLYFISSLEPVYFNSQVIPQPESKDLIDLIVKIEGMLMAQDKYWSINYIPSAKAYSIYISTEEPEDDE